MPASVIGDFILRPILEILLHFVAFYSGCLILSILSIGRLNIAPWTDVGKYNKKRFELDLFLVKNGIRYLKPEYTMITGMLFWIVVGIVIYVLTK